MARLKKDHSGWNSYGLYLKYKQPTAQKIKSKKDTNRWCRGKIGVPHELHQQVHVRFKSTTWYKTWCVECGKSVPKKRVSSYPLHAEIKYGGPNGSFPVQVKVNGKPIPIDARLYDDNSYFCNQCEQWHYE